jgi:lysophospholipase L1-like esterase
VYRQLKPGKLYQKTVNIKASNLAFDPISKRYRNKNINLSEFASQDAWFKKNTDGIAATLLIVKKIQDHLASKNISLKVAYLPIAEEIYYSDWGAELNIKTSPGLSAGAVLKPHILELGLPFKDLTPPLRRVRKSKAPLYLPLDVHPNEKGHKFIAQQMNEFLQNRNIKN